MSFFAKKISDSRKGHLFELYGVDETGTKAYYFLLVDKIRVTAFKNELKRGAFYLLDYGKILASGFGHNPPQKLKESILAKCS